MHEAGAIHDQVDGTIDEQILIKANEIAKKQFEKWKKEYDENVKRKLEFDYGSIAFKSKFIFKRKKLMKKRWF